jgi:hypothetical protein
MNVVVIGIERISLNLEDWAVSEVNRQKRFIVNVEIGFYEHREEKNPKRIMMSAVYEVNRDVRNKESRWPCVSPNFFCFRVSGWLWLSVVVQLDVPSSG